MAPRSPTKSVWTPMRSSWVWTSNPMDSTEDSKSTLPNRCSVRGVCSQVPSKQLGAINWNICPEKPEKVWISCRSILHAVRQDGAEHQFEPQHPLLDVSKMRLVDIDL